MAICAYLDTFIDITQNRLAAERFPALPGRNEAFMFENKKQPLASPQTFYRRIGRNFLFTLIILAVSLVIGTAGFYLTRDPQCSVPVTLLDAFHNSAMLLSGMGPVLQCYTSAGKWFSSGYALFGGIVLVTNIGILLSPALHRIFHKLHLEE